MLHNIVSILWHCALWSVLSIGGNTVALSDIYRVSVETQHWLNPKQFVAFFAISQALPGPNGMALVLIGQKAAGLPGAFTALIAKLVPSSLIAYSGASWYESNQKRPMVQMVKAALIPVTVGLLLAATFVLAREVDTKPARIILTLGAALIIHRTKLNPVWLIVASAAAGLASVVTGAGIF